MLGALVTMLAVAWTARVPSRGRDRARPVGASERLRRGERLYREGLLPSGALLRGRHPGGGEVSGALAACAGCHRRSGMGTFEGNRVIPPVAGPFLFQPRAHSARRARRTPHARPRSGARRRAQSAAPALHAGHAASARCATASTPPDNRSTS